MKVTWTPETAGAQGLTLADDSLPQGAGTRRVIDFAPDFERLAQVTPLVQSAARKVSDRLNVLPSVSLTLLAEFDSVDACRVWACDLAGLMPERGTLDLEFEGQSHRVLTAAVWLSISFPVRLGVSIQASLRFSGETLSQPQT